MDTHTTISSTEVRQNFAEVLDSVEKLGTRYTLTVNGKPKVVLVSAEEFDSMLETIEILSDRKLVAAIRKGQKQLERGESITLEELLHGEA